MNQVDLLNEVASNLKVLADNLVSVADTLAERVAQKDIEVPQVESKQHDVTLEQVRAVLAEKSQNGFTAEIRELLTKHGAKRLSDIEPGEYAALLAEAEGLQ